VANCYTAIEQGVEVIPFSTRSTSPSADPERVIDEIEDIIGIDATDAVRASAKNGIGIDDILEAVIAKVPPPSGDRDAPLPRCIIDSWFDNYVGVVMLVRVDGRHAASRGQDPADGAGATYNCEQVGVFTPKSVAREELSAGDVGFIIAGIKEIDAAKVGDTVTLANAPAPRRCRASRTSSRRCSRALSGRVQPVRSAARRARQAEAQRRVACITSPRCRRRSASASAAASWASCTWTSCRSASSASTTWTSSRRRPPSIYQVLHARRHVLEIENPSKLPDLSRVEEIREPIITATILMPQEYVGP
jgi:GTP-binding protein LepA